MSEDYEASGAYDGTVFRFLQRVTMSIATEARLEDVALLLEPKGWFSLAEETGYGTAPGSSQDGSKLAIFTALGWLVVTVHQESSISWCDRTKGAKWRKEILRLGELL